MEQAVWLCTHHIANLLSGYSCPSPARVPSLPSLVQGHKEKNTPRWPPQRWKMLVLGFQAPNRDRGLEGMGPLALHQVVIHSTQASPRWWEMSSAHSPMSAPQTLHNTSAGNFPS